MTCRFLGGKDFFGNAPDTKYKTMKIYTRSGDNGETSLGNGLRVAKDQFRIHVCGMVDELSAVLGVARAEGFTPQQENTIVRIQQELIQFCAEITIPDCKPRIKPAHVEKMESEIDEIEAKLPQLTQFVISGTEKISATIHLARTVCRRAERYLITLIRTEPNISQTLCAYLNRLSDLLFVMARQAEYSLERRTGSKSSERFDI
jgi:cob(I)alamin adenosyltransferase